MAKRVFKYDVTSQDKLAQQVTENVALKGFCVIDFKVADATLKLARTDVQKLQVAGRFVQPPEEIVDGLLGADGSADICELDTSKDGDGLAKADLCLTQLSEQIQKEMSQRMGFKLSSRSGGLLHIAGAPEDDAPEMTDSDCDMWLSQFLKMRIMLVMFLGPGGGSLELQPWRHEEVPAFEVQTEPGMIVALNTDTLTHKYFSSRHGAALTCYLNQDSANTLQLDNLPTDVPPYVKELSDKTMERLKTLKDQELMLEEGTVANVDVPVHWRQSMNRLYHKGNGAATRSFACKMPGTWSPEEWAHGICAGVDCGISIPFKRFTYEDTWDPNPESYKFNKHCQRHGTFIDGAEFFDPKPFNISIAEAKIMDPNQKYVLEVAYECLLNAGLKKKQLLKSLIGSYCGVGMPEFTFMPQDMSSGFGGTTVANSITANRLSFCLGLQGPNVAIDVGAASCMVGLWQSVDTLRYQTDNYKPNHSCLVIGVTCILASMPIVWASAAGWLSPEGRCFCFDASANGRLRGEGTACIMNNRFTNVVDGKEMINEDQPLLGIIEGVHCMHVGKSASLAAPSGPAEKEMVHYTVRQAGISCLDIELAEAHSEGGPLSDAVETMAMRSALRDEDPTVPLSISACKSGAGFQGETSAMASIMKVVYCQRNGVLPSLVHLYELNPNIDVVDDDDPLQFLTEIGANKSVSSFEGVCSRGMGGTVGYCVPWGIVDTSKKYDIRATPVEKLEFWPAGGGSLEQDQVARRTYSIVGTWSEWSSPKAMEREEDGVFGYNVTIGVNGYEQFAILLDGSFDKALFPYSKLSKSGEGLCGPAPFQTDFVWTIDGEEGSTASAALEDGPSSSVAVKKLGVPGDKYRVRMRIAGKWRSVEWEKIESGSGKLEDAGKYYLVGSNNDWLFETEMTPTGEAGVYSADVKLNMDKLYFQVARNKDYNQIFQPRTRAADAGAEISGPAIRIIGLNWLIESKKGETWKVKFQRAPSSGELKISWTKIS